MHIISSPSSKCGMIDWMHWILAVSEYTEVNICINHGMNIGRYTISCGHQMYKYLKHMTGLARNIFIYFCFDLLGSGHNHFLFMINVCLWINIASGNNLMLHGTKPLPGPLLTSHYWGSVVFSREQFHNGRQSVHNSLRPSDAYMRQ